MTARHFTPVVESSRSLRTHSNASTSALRVLWIIAACILVVSVWVWWSRGNDVTRLPEAQRHALYERTLGTLKTFCDAQKPLPGLEDYCSQQARLALDFPECDASCRALAEPYQPRATR